MRRLEPRVRDFSTRRATTLRGRSFLAKCAPNLAGLYPYQAEGVRFLRERRWALLADEMGLGKTIQLLRALPNVEGGFVLAPAFLLKVWRDEARRWRPELELGFAAGEMRPPLAGELLIESYDSLPELDALLVELRKADWSRVRLLLDEAHYVKNEAAARTEKTRLLRSFCRGCWGATGTPLPNAPTDLYGVLASIGLEQAVFGAEPEKRFREVFPQGEALATESVPSLLAPVMLRRTRAEVLPDLPGKTYQDVPVALDGDVRGELDLAARECRELELGELPPFERLSGARRALADAKTPFALEFVGNAAAAGPVVVFSAHTRPIERIGSLPGARAIVGSTPDREREAAIEAFQRGELAILALTIGAGGVGLTLTRSSHVVFVDRAYNPGDNEQAEDRLARIGQENKVLVTRLVSEHAIDRRLNEILDRKQKTIADALGGKRK